MRTLSVWVRGLGGVPQIGRSFVRFLVRTQAWVTRGFGVEVRPERQSLRRKAGWAGTSPLSRRQYPQAATWRLEKLSPRALARQVLRLLQRYGLDPGERSPAPAPPPARSGGGGAGPRAAQDPPPPPCRLLPVSCPLPLSGRSGHSNSRRWGRSPSAHPGRLLGGQASGCQPPRLHLHCAHPRPHRSPPCSPSSGVTGTLAFCSLPEGRGRRGAALRTWLVY